MWSKNDKILSTQFVNDPKWTRLGNRKFQKFSDSLGVQIEQKIKAYWEAQESNAVHHCHKEADLQLPRMSIFELFGAELHFFW